MKQLFLLLFFADFIFANELFSPIPPQYIENKEKYTLGKELFFDTNLSLDKTISCASCHLTLLYGTDGKRVSVGVYGRQGFTNASSIFNTKYNITQDWIGKDNTIQKKTAMAFFNHDEMEGNISKVLAYIKSSKHLRQSFKKLYKEVNEENFFEAISYYVENLTTPNARFDKYLQGDSTALSEAEKQGYHLFIDYSCVSCHNGINIGGNMYQKIGIFSQNMKRKDNDLGRYLVTYKASDKYVFMVPSLRNVSKTGPYFHDGSIKTLQKVIEFMGKYQLGVAISQEDNEKIELFLKTLQGELPNGL